MMIWYLAATVVVFAICFLAYRSAPRQHADLMGVSALLCVGFAMGNLFHAIYGLPDAILGFPIIDLAMVLMIYRAWTKNADRWKVVMVASFVAQLSFHVVVLAMWYNGTLTHQALYAYVVAINGLFIVQLLTLSSVGLKHGLDSVRRSMSRRWSGYPVTDDR